MSAKFEEAQPSPSPSTNRWASVRSNVKSMSRRASKPEPKATKPPQSPHKMVWLLDTVKRRSSTSRDALILEGNRRQSGGYGSLSLLEQLKRRSSTFTGRSDRRLSNPLVSGQVKRRGSGADVKPEYDDAYVGKRNEDGEPDGPGLAVLPGGDTYDGEWRNGLFEGHGVYRFNDKTEYRGRYRAGKRHGKGIEIFLDGSIYEGHYRMNKRDGRGIERYKNGATFEGNYKNDARDGLGTYIYANGEAEIGGYRNGEDFGTGVRWSEDHSAAWLLRDGMEVRALTLEEAGQAADSLGLPEPPRSSSGSGTSADPSKTPSKTSSAAASRTASLHRFEGHMRTSERSLTGGGSCASGLSLGRGGSELTLGSSDAMACSGNDRSNLGSNLSSRATSWVGGRLEARPELTASFEEPPADAGPCPGSELAPASDLAPARRPPAMQHQTTRTDDSIAEAAAAATAAAVAKEAAGSPDFDGESAVPWELEVGK